MKQVWVFLIAAVLALGSVQAATPQNTALHTELVAWQDEGADGFSASYDYTSLTEVVDDYWASLSALGYNGTVTRVSRYSSTYLFQADEETLEATFTLYSERVTATLSRRSDRALLQRQLIAVAMTPVARPPDSGCARNIDYRPCDLCLVSSSDVDGHEGYQSHPRFS